MSKKNRLSLADLGLIVEDAPFAMPEPADSILTSVPDGSGTEEALAGIAGGDTSPGTNWKPEMQGQPADAPEDRTAETLPDAGEGIASSKGGSQSGGQASDSGKQSGGQQGDDKKPAFLKKEEKPAEGAEPKEPKEEKTEESFKLSAEDIGLVLDENDENPFKQDGEDRTDDAEQGDDSNTEERGGESKSDLEPRPGQQQDNGVNGVEECNGRMMDHNMGAGEIAVDQELMKDIIRAAVADQPDDSQIDLIVQAIAGCCGEDRTLTVADAEQIMGKLKELAGGQQGGQQMGGQQGGQQMGQQPGQQGQQGQQPGQQGGQQGAQMGGQQGSPEQIDSIPPGDGEVAGPEGGQQHEGKTKLMAAVGESVKGKKVAGKKTLAEAWLAAVPGVGVGACINNSLNEDDADEDTIQLREMARKMGHPEWFNVGRK
jgi:hypothetical protein